MNTLYRRPTNTASTCAQRVKLNDRYQLKGINMKIGIIGAGNIGSTLARKLSAAGHTIKLAASRSPDELREHAEKVGAKAVSPAEAVKDVEALILTIPFGKNRDIAAILADVPASVVVIDTSNYYPFRDGQIAEVDHGKPESVWSSEQFGRPVVKAFNAILADVFANQGKPQGEIGRIAIPIAGDDAQAKAIVQELVNATGFDAVDAGTLADSWRQQPGTPAYCTALSSDELRKAIFAADKTAAPKNRDEIMAFLGEPNIWPSTEKVIDLCREFYNRK
nr:NAD(P)-binding domain-containing protein [Paracoccus liaowanqingii]